MNFLKFLQNLAKLFLSFNDDTVEPDKPTETETPVEPEVPANPDKPEEQTKTFVRAEGNKLFNEKNEEITLHGVNLGGWLLQEYWMCPIKGDSNIEKWTHLETLDTLERRFGIDKTQELMDTYYNNFIMESDIKNIAEKGANTIRIPFWYRNFMLNPDGDWIKDNLDENPGFKILDWAIKTAGKYGIYVVLDMHGCPGGQSYDHCAGSARKCELFSNEKYIEAMEKLWTAIASRYKDNQTVAVYDIMNEAKTYDGEVLSDPRNKIYDRMYKAIRNIDKNHMISMEAIWTLDKLPKPNEMNWENVIYQLHSYGDDADSYCKNVYNYGKQNNVPMYVGEFMDMNIIKKCNELNMSYTSWAYKGAVTMNDTWFWHQKYITQADILKDSFDTIKRKWGTPIQTKNMNENKNVTVNFE